MPDTADPITSLHGIGPQLADKLARIDIHSRQDLLWHLPLRYRDLTRITPIGGLSLHGEALVEGTIRGCDVVFGRRRSLLCLIQDGSGVLALRFYHFSKAQQQQLLAGRPLRAWGEVRRGHSGFEMYHPEYRLLDSADLPPLADRLTPVYPVTEGLQQPRLRKLIEQVLQKTAADKLPDWLPPALLPDCLGFSLHQALHYLHQPPVDAAVAQLQEGSHPAQQRLAFEEMVAHHLSLLRLRQQQKREPGIALAAHPSLPQRFLAALPFTLTAATITVS